MSLKKSAAVRAAEGDLRKIGRRKLEEQMALEPTPRRGYPPPPRHLSKAAKAAWAFFVPELEAMDVDARPDSIMLEGACVWYARAVEADKLVEEHGLIGEPFKASKFSWQMVAQFCTQFGLTPRSRASVAKESLARPESGDEELKRLLQ